MQRLRSPGLAFIISAGIAALSPAAAAEDKDHARPCEALAGADVPGGRVTLAEDVAADAPPVTEASLPRHCLVRGMINPRTGTDGRPYALTFELRLAAEWNGRFYYQGGGVDGVLFKAIGTYSGGGNTRNALLDGYAVVTTDSGYQAVLNLANGRFLFSADPQARLEYGNLQVPRVTAAAKWLIARFYGRGPDRSYFYGSSNGGRQAMIAAQQFPDLFDGILASAPGFRLPQASIQALHQAQLTASVAPRGPDRRPDMARGLDAAEKETVARRSLRDCDALDGALDGMVGSPNRLYKIAR